jgi:hypothetical protein
VKDLVPLSLLREPILQSRAMSAMTRDPAILLFRLSKSLSINQPCADPPPLLNYQF